MVWKPYNIFYFIQYFEIIISHKINGITIY